MAPKKGGGSSSSSSSGGSGSSSCESCTAPLQLYGYEWKNSRVTARFAFYIIAVIFLFGCLILASRFKWVRKAPATRDRLRRTGFVIATSSAITYFILRIIDSALIETETLVTHLFYIIFILESAFWRISEILILAIIVRTMYESTISSSVKALPTTNTVFITILTLLSLAGFGLFTAYEAQQIGSYYTYGYSTIIDSMNYIDLSYDAVYFLMTILVVVFGALVAVKERSRATLILAAVVAPALFFRSLFVLTDQAVGTFYETSTIDNRFNIMWANYFIYIITTIAIFGGVAFIGIIKPVGYDYQMHQKPDTTQGPIHYGNGIEHNGYNNNQGVAGTSYGNGQQIEGGHVPGYANPQLTGHNNMAGGFHR